MGFFLKKSELFADEPGPPVRNSIAPEILPTPHPSLGEARQRAVDVYATTLRSIPKCSGSNLPRIREDRSTRGISTPPMSPWGQVRRQRRRARVFRFTPDCRHVDQRWISSIWARIGLVLFWPNMEARGSEASSRAGLLLVGYLASKCCVNHSVAGPAEASKSFT